MPVCTKLFTLFTLLAYLNYTPRLRYKHEDQQDATTNCTQWQRHMPVLRHLVLLKSDRHTTPHRTAPPQLSPP